MRAARDTAAGTRGRSRRRIVAALGVTALAAVLAVGVWFGRGPKPLTWHSLLNATYATSVSPRGAAGWRVNSLGIVRPRAGDPYAIAIVTDGRVSWQEGIETIEGIAAPLNAVMRSMQ